MPNPLAHLPSPAQKRIALHVTPHAERAIRQGHPWLFDQSITRQSHPGQPGDLAVVFDSKREFLAIGLYDPASPIRVRILQARRPAAIDSNWFAGRLTEAIARRKPLAQSPAPTTGYRLVHGENDGLPGLVIDKYAATLVLKLYTPAWLPHLNVLLPALQQHQPSERLILRFSRALLKQPQHLHNITDGELLAGEPLTGPLIFQENGLNFEADPILGQKTGFFLDQRENRARVESLAGGKSVLNAFAYTGGFSVYAARGGATRITSLDISAPSLAAAGRNIAHNNHVPAIAAARHDTIAGDAFTLLENLATANRSFDLVIIDPPMFAHNQSQTAHALAAYQRLTRLGLAVLSPGGILVQASCSSRVPAEDFFNAIHQTAASANRPLTELEHTFHPLDHPIAYPEGAYLKCFFARAD